MEQLFLLSPHPLLNNYHLIQEHIEVSWFEQNLKHLFEYIAFHTRLIPLKEQLLVVEFEQVIENPVSTVTGLARNLCLHVSGSIDLNNLDTAAQDLVREMHRKNALRSRTISADDSIALPRAASERKKPRAELSAVELLAACNQIYHTMIS